MRLSYIGDWSGRNVVRVFCVEGVRGGGVGKDSSFVIGLLENGKFIRLLE